MWPPILPSPRNAIFIAGLFHLDLEVAQMQGGRLWLRRKVTAVARQLGGAALYVPAQAAISGMMHQFYGHKAGKIIHPRRTAKVRAVSPRRSEPRQPRRLDSQAPRRLRSEESLAGKKSSK